MDSELAFGTLQTLTRNLVGEWIEGVTPNTPLPHQLTHPLCHTPPQKGLEGLTHTGG